MAQVSLANNKVGVTLALGYKAQTLVEGAVTWPGPSAFVGPSLSFYNKLFLRGPSLEYRFFDRGQKHGLSFFAYYFDDDDPMIALDNTEESYRNSRSDSLPIGINYSYNFGKKNRFSIGLRLQKDVIDYGGGVYELKLSIPLIPFTKLNLSQSYVSQSSAEYFYGQGTSSGAGYSKYGISIFLPFLPLGGRMSLSFNQSIINQGAARQAHLIRGDYNNSNLNLVMFWSLR